MCKRTIIPVFIFSIISLSANLAISQTAKVSSSNQAYYTVDGKSIAGYLAKPKSPGKHPAIILVHEWWGLNEDIKSKARDFAGQGYVAFAVDLYNGEHTTNRREAGRLAGGVRSNMEAAFANLKAAIEFVKKDASVDTGRLASIGWCFGGGWSYQIARNNLGCKASVIYYGRFNPQDDLQKMRAEIIGHFAENDRGIRVDTVKEFQAKLKTLNGEHEIYIYPNTTHGFASRPGENPRYNEEAARLAWERTLAFLKKHL